MQQQPTGLGQPEIACGPSTRTLSYPPLDSDDIDIPAGMNLPLRPRAGLSTERSSSDDIHGSPVGDWKDTPRTLYKASPETEVGDSDVLSDLEADGTEGDGDGAWNGRGIRTSLFDTNPHLLNSGEPGFSTCEPSSPAAFQTFARRLHADIRSTSSLFPGIPLESLPRQASPIQHAACPQRMRINAASQGVPTSGDVTVDPPLLHIPRKRSMHLEHPSINPYQRPKAGESNPTHRYPAVVIDRAFLRRFRTASPPQQTVSMKDLLVPHAEFRFGYDPELLASELDSPSVHGLDNPDDGMKSDVTEGLEQGINMTPQTPDDTRKESSMDEIDSWDIPDSTDDGTWTPQASNEVRHEPVVKRRKTNAGAPSNATGGLESPGTLRAAYESLPRTRRPHHDLAKARKRHLQPNLVRTNGCLYGCPLLFSTAYEARRHQEDTHGREEAYSFIKAAAGDLEGPILAKDYRFLLQIALHSLGDKLDHHARARIEEALNQDSVVLQANVVDTVARFARDWTKRYECPRCGASFSRLDSKKRHYEKQCR